MIRLIFATIVGLIFARVSMAEPVWLVVGASDASPAGIAIKSRPLGILESEGLIFQSSDCGDKKNIFGWTATIAITQEAAKTVLRQVRQKIKDAYIKRCEVIPDSLLALRIPAVDASISEVSDTAVNWSDEDRLSTVVSLGDGRSIVVVRHFVSDPEDPLEGRRERILLTMSSSERVTLNLSCSDLGGATVYQGLVAFHCVREQAADNLLHDVVVVDSKGIILNEIKRCRNPKWKDKRTLLCEAENVGPNGKLTLIEKQTQIAK